MFRNKWSALAVISAALFLIGIDMTVLYTALPTLTRELDATNSGKLWIINTYPLVMAGLLPGLGTLGDRFGHRLVFMGGLSFFGIASLLAAFSPSVSLLIGSRALLAYLSRHGAHRAFAGLVSVAGWFTVDDLISYPALVPWVNLDLNFTSIASAAGPITVHLSDNDPFTADWRANAADWLGKVGAAVHIAHGAGHYMTTSPGPVLDVIQLASLRTIER